MKDEQLEDLKEFITTTISQVEVRLGDDISEVKSEISELRQEMRTGFEDLRANLQLSVS